jgi:hypothetical protein
MNWLLAVVLSSFVGTAAPDCMIVEFTSDNCGPCKQLQPALEQLQREGWVVRTVNVEREPLLVRKFAVESLPTLVLISGGKEVDRIVGAAPYEKILPRLAKLLLSSSLSTPDSSLRASAPQALAAVPAPSARTSPSAAAQGWQTSPQSQTPSPGITVRGQSPASGAFPMLAAATSSALAPASASQAIADKFNALPRSTPPTSAAAAPASFSAPVDSQATPLQALSEQPMATEPLSAMPLSREPSRLPPQLAPQAMPTANTSGPIDLQKAIARAEAATVRIRVDEENTTAYGTGTIIDVHGDEALVLTCGHIFREMKPHSQLTIDLFADRSQPMNIPAQLIDFQATPGAEDIGLLSFRLPLAIEPVPLLPKVESLTIGQPAFSFGCDHGETPTRRDTSVKNINRYLGAANVEIVGAPAVGRSGGGLFDNQGRLIGVCNAADAAGDEGIYAAAGIVYTQIDRLGLTHLFNDKAPPRAAPVQLASSPGQPKPTAQPSAAAQNPLPAPSPAQPSFGAPLSQLTCIVRDASGREQVVTVDSPSSDLLDAIHRQAKRQPALTR